MASHIGTRCIVCSEKFTSEDDVVICPDCGTPYHRACYKKEGNCVNTVLHQNGGSWKPSYDVGSGDGECENTVCSFCGYTNPPLTLFCQNCGMPSGMNSTEDLDQRYGGININIDPDAYNRNANGGVSFSPFFINFSDPLCGFNPEEDVEGVKMWELGDFVGTNTHYYLPLFKQFKDLGRKFSLNLSAMLFPELYFSYRKMPLIALAALVLRILSRVPNFIYAFAGVTGYGAISEIASRFDVKSAAFQGVALIGSAIYYALMFTFGFFGNKLYYNHTLRKIKRVRSSRSGMDLRYALSRKGGTSALLLSLFICLMAVPYAAIYFVQMSAVMNLR